MVLELWVSESETVLHSVRGVELLSRKAFRAAPASGPGKSAQANRVAPIVFSPSNRFSKCVVCAHCVPGVVLGKQQGTISILNLSLECMSLFLASSVASFPSHDTACSWFLPKSFLRVQGWTVFCLFTSPSFMYWLFVIPWVTGWLQEPLGITSLLKADKGMHQALLFL